MGFPMALNLRKGLSADHAMYVCDVSDDVIERFKTAAEGMGPVYAIKNGKEAVTLAVCCGVFLHKLGSVDQMSRIR